MSANRPRYADTPLGSLSFQQDADGVVWVSSRTALLGGWTVDRFGGRLNAAGIRQWVAFVACKHDESLYGRCVACGKTWEQQASGRAS